ncbi:hypothetical protein QQ045_013118 [Rhodiola kirilowii]
MTTTMVEYTMRSRILMSQIESINYQMHLQTICSNRRMALSEEGEDVSGKQMQATLEDSSNLVEEPIRCPM